MNIDLGVLSDEPAHEIAEPLRHCPVDVDEDAARAAELEAEPYLLDPACVTRRNLIMSSGCG